MKTLTYTFALVSLAWLASSCGDDSAPLPDDYTNVGVNTGDINTTLLGSWTGYMITETTYANGTETIEVIGNYSGDFYFEASGSSFVDLVVYDFPYTGTFEVNRYGERMTFYERSYDEHNELMLTELSPATVIFEDREMIHEDYFIVTSYTLTR